MLERYVDDQRLRDAIALPGDDRDLRRAAATRAPRRSGSCTIRATCSASARSGATSRAASGRASFAIADAALEAGATLAAGLPVAAIGPGEGVELESGERIAAPVVICNADPKRCSACSTRARRELPADYRERLEGWDVQLAGDEAQRRPEPLSDLPGRAGRARCPSARR